MLSLWLLWAAFSSTVLVCGVLSWFKPSPGTFASDPSKIAPLVGAVGFLSAIFFVASFVVRHKLCSRTRVRQLLEKNSDWLKTQPTEMEMKDAKALGTTPLEDQVAKSLFVGYVASWTIAEAIALHGFALSHHTGDRFIYLWFAVPSLISLLVGRPDGPMVRDEIKRALSFTNPH
jgi:hypothetical protein